MTAAPAGAVVSIAYDADERVEVGDWLRTPTGRGYHVLAVRVQARGKHAGTRHHLRALVATAIPHGAPPNGRVHALHWYPRDRKQA